MAGLGRKAAFWFEWASRRLIASELLQAITPRTNGIAMLRHPGRIFIKIAKMLGARPRATGSRRIRRHHSMNMRTRGGS
jgi:hypothetical protein